MTLNKINTIVIFMASLLALTSAKNTCGARCNSDRDCRRGGGFIECGKCNLYQGTQGYKTCYNDQPSEQPPVPEPSTHDYFPIGGSCSNRCKNDRDCQKGGFNPCGKCGKYAGMEMYQRCYQPNPTPPTPTPHNYFPEGGSCSNRCKTDRDCRNGGFNPCGKCGKYAGTQMYQRCYQPQDNGRRLDSCGTSCESDSDCHQGGFISCGKCNLYQGSLGYKTCYDDQQPGEESSPTAAPSTHDYFLIGGSCRKECESNADCQNGGGFNPCGKCGQVQGTEMYHVCYETNDEGRSLLRGSM